MKFIEIAEKFGNALLSSMMKAVIVLIAIIVGLLMLNTFTPVNATAPSIITEDGSSHVEQAAKGWHPPMLL